MGVDAGRYALDMKVAASRLNGLFANAEMNRPYDIRAFDILELRNMFIDAQGVARAIKQDTLDRENDQAWAAYQVTRTVHEEYGMPTNITALRELKRSAWRLLHGAGRDTILAQESLRTFTYYFTTTLPQELGPRISALTLPYKAQRWAGNIAEYMRTGAMNGRLGLFPLSDFLDMDRLLEQTAGYVEDRLGSEHADLPKDARAAHSIIVCSLNLMSPERIISEVTNLRNLITSVVVDSQQLQTLDHARSLQFFGELVARVPLDDLVRLVELA